MKQGGSGRARPDRARVEIEFDSGTAVAGLTQVRSALDQLTAPLERVSDETRRMIREQKEAKEQASQLARTLGRTLPSETGELERTFRRLFQSDSGLKGILRSFANDARRILFGLLEDWIGGVRAAGASASSGLVGMLFGGGIGGTLLGLPPAAGGTPPFFASAFPSSRGGGYPSLNLAQILSRLGINLRGIAGLSGSTVFSGGLALALTGAGVGGVGGALLGAGGGALAGFSVGGPIGAIIGGIAGLFGGLFGGGRGQQKRAASEIANRGFERIHELFLSYQQFRLDYAEALARMNQVWAEMEAQWRAIGGSVGRQSISSQRVYFDQILRAMEEIQRERQRRQGVIEGFPLPEFQAGGFVDFAGGRSRGAGGAAGVLAVLHPGEFVISRPAVELLGRPRLEELNRGEAAARGGDSFHVTIVAADARGFEEMLARNEQSLVRVIRRAARDRGRSAPL